MPRPIPVPHVAIHGRVWLPFLQPDGDPSFLKEGFLSLSAENRATLLHELTHGLLQAGTISAAFIACVVQDLWGLYWLTSTFQSLASLPAATRPQVMGKIWGDDAARVLAGVGVEFESPETIADAVGRLWITYAFEYRQIGAALTTAIGWLHEGLALITELDFLPCAKSARHQSVWYEFVLSAIRPYPPSTLDEKDSTIALLSAVVRRKDGREGAIDLPVVLKGIVNAAATPGTSVLQGLFNAAATPLTAADRRRRIWSLLNPNDRIPDHVFAGYLALRGVQRRLAERDRRVADPEVFLTLVIGYFRSDEIFLDFLVAPSFQQKLYATPLPESPLDWMTASILAASLATLLHVKTDHLRDIIDAIENPGESSVDFQRLNVAARVKGEPLAHVSYDYWIEMITEFLQLKTKRDLEECKDTMPSDLAKALVREGEQYRDVLRHLCYRAVEGSLLFPLLSTTSCLLGFARAGKKISLFWHYPEIGEDAVRVETYPSDDAAVKRLLEYFSSIRQPVPKLKSMPASDSVYGWCRPSNAMRSAIPKSKGRVCQEKWFFSHSARRNLVVRQHGRHLHLVSVTQPGDDPAYFKDAGNLEPVVRALPWRDRWLDQWVSGVMRQSREGEWPAPSPNGWLEALAGLWPELYPGASADPPRLRRFFSERIHHVAAEDAEWKLLGDVAESGSQLISVGSPEHQAIDHTNQRWYRLTGERLVEMEPKDGSQVLARWNF